MAESDYLLHQSLSPRRKNQQINSIRTQYGYEPKLSVAVTNGVKKSAIFPYLDVVDLTHVPHEGFMADSLSQVREKIGEGGLLQLKAVGEEGEQEWNRLLQVDSTGPYYPFKDSSLCYTAGAAVAKLTATTQWVKDLGVDDLLSHELNAYDWHISHGPAHSPTTIENKPYTEGLESLLQRLYQAQTTGESFYSSNARAYTNDNGTISVVETLVNCGRLNPELEFEQIAEYVTRNKDVLPAGMDLARAMQSGILVDGQDEALIYQRLYAGGGIHPGIWQEYVLKNDYRKAAEDREYVPRGDSLITAEIYRKIPLRALDPIALKKVFFGEFD